MTKYEQLTQYIEQMISNAGSGHYASSMSALEIMYDLFYVFKIKPEQFILSKGHAAPALYAILYDLGYIDSIDKFRQYGGLPGHPSIETPGVLCSSGSLGMGISKAIGLAHVNKDTTYHVLVGDGELQEGQNWEAMLYLTHSPMDNIVIHVDANGKQYSGDVLLQCTNKNMSGSHIVIHNTTWRHDNHYLTRQEPTPYSQKIKRYSEQLMKLMAANEKVICLNADLEQDFGLTVIKEQFPDRYIQCGISEQHMVSMAGGLARAGMSPVCHTFGAFYRRAIDQMWNNACDALKIGYVAGLTDYINIGSSHKASDKRMFRYIGVEPVDSIDEFFNALGRDAWRSVYVEVL